MIRKIEIEGFKRFAKVGFEMPGHIVVAGPNNSGKTTLLQAIAAFDLALSSWKRLNSFQRHGGAYPWCPIARHAFSAVPLRKFDLLWNELDVAHSIVITVESALGWRIAMELQHDTTEQIKVRPRAEIEPERVRQASLATVYVPAMTGLEPEEPLYARAEFLDTTLSRAQPGRILRNVLVQAKYSEESWRALTEGVRRLFGCELLPPEEAGAFILAEYVARPGGPRLDIASAGSGFQQVLMLLAFLHTRPGSVLLLDEPDAHLHVILQDAIYGELRAVAAQKRSKLIVATHSEVIIDSVPLDELCVMFDQPRKLVDAEERRRVGRALGGLSHTDVMLATSAPGVLYLEDATDLGILRAWARVLNHPAQVLLTTSLFWHRSVIETREGAPGLPSREHHEMLKLVRSDLPGLELLDRDGNPNLPATEIVGKGLQRIRWKRYEIESYLVHPAALCRFVERQLGPGGQSEAAKKSLLAAMEKLFQPAFMSSPLGNHPLVEGYLAATKARTEVLPPLLEAGGLPAFPSGRYHEIAAAMLPEEIHPEVKEKLDAICRAFGVAL